MNQIYLYFIKIIEIKCFCNISGQWLIETTRPDIVKKFAPLLKDDLSVISQYIHQCNAQSPT